MNVKKAVKRIAALATGATMVTATIVGAMAYDLSDYPEPFVKDGVFNGNIVIGESAKVADVYGAIDVAASLQAAAKEPVSTEGASETVSVSGEGVKLEGSSDDFNIGDDVSEFELNGEYDDDDFPELLAEGTVEDDDGTEYDYEQRVALGSAGLQYTQDDDYDDEPIFNLDVSGMDMTYTVEFDDVIDLSDSTDDKGALSNSESIEMFGKTYTFDPDMDDGDEFILYGSDQSVTVTQDEPVTVQSEGEEYEIEILGGNTDDSSAIIRVTGDGTDTRTMEEGDSRKMAGLEMFVNDVFISNIGEDTISVSIFVGSEKLVIPESDGEEWDEIEINNDDDTEIQGQIIGGGLDAFEGFKFKFNLEDFEDAEIGDEWELLPMGRSFTDPLFGFELAFDSMTPKVDDRTPVELSRSGDAYELAFETNGGDEIELDLFELNEAETDIRTGEDGNVKFGVQTLEEDEFFILEDSAAKRGDRETYVFEVTDIDFDDTVQEDSEFTLKSLGDGKSTTYEQGEQIEDTGVFVDVANETELGLYNGTDFGVADNEYTSLDYFVTKGGLVVNVTDAGAGVLTFAEDEDDKDEADMDEFDVTIGVDDSEIEMTKVGDDDWAGADAQKATDADGDYEYGISEHGTWYELETDNDGDYLNVYYAEEQTDFNVFLNGPDATIVSSGSSSGDAYQLNEIGVGLAVYDDEAMNLLGDTPLLVVGGPCVNTVAMDLMDNPEVCSEGFTEGRAKIKLFESQNALLVAGHNGEDTTGATRVLANYDEYDLSGDEVEVITTDLTDLEVSSVE
ncbi:MAG: S-layer protein [Candidatus Woesearchaeota archaeon]